MRKKPITTIRSLSYGSHTKKHPRPYFSLRSPSSTSTLHRQKCQHFILSLQAVWIFHLVLSFRSKLSEFLIWDTFSACPRTYNVDPGWSYCKSTARQALELSRQESIYLVPLAAGISTTLMPSCATSVKMLPRHRSSRKPTAFTYRFPCNLEKRFSPWRTKVGVCGCVFVCASRCDNGLERPRQCGARCCLGTKHDFMFRFLISVVQVVYAFRMCAQHYQALKPQYHHTLRSLQSHDITHVWSSSPQTNQARDWGEGRRARVKSKPEASNKEQHTILRETPRPAGAVTQIS